MSAEVKLRDILAAEAPLVAVVGARIYNKFVPDGISQPSIAFIRMNTEYMNTVHGTAAEIKVTFDIYCVANSDAIAEAIGDLVAAMVVPPPNNMVKTNRIALYDSETEMHAAVITVDVDSDTTI